MPKLKTEINPIDSTWIYYRSLTSKLMYFVNYKCASTLYRSWFAKIGWEMTQLPPADIDWENYYVFSYIRDPLIKHRKSIVEFFANQHLLSPLESAIKNDNRWVYIISNIIALDGHSRTIRSILGEKYPLNIDWIPIDGTFDHKKYTLNLLEAHGEKISNKHKQKLYDAGRVNESTTAEDKIFKQLMTTIPTSQILNYIDFDQCIYDIVIDSSDTIMEN